MMKKIGTFFECTIKTIALATSMCLIILFITNSVYIRQSIKEIPEYYKYPADYYAVLILCILSVILLAKLLDKISGKVLFSVCAVIYITVGLFLIFNMPLHARADQGKVLSSAIAINNGDYSSLEKGGYLYIYPNNLGIVAFLRLITVISSDLKFITLINLILVIATNYIIYKISDALFDSNTTKNKYTILLSFSFLPQLFYVLFVYGTVPGFFCISVMVYMTSRVFKTDDADKMKVCYIIIAVIFASLAVLLKNNYLIAVFANLIVCVVHWFKNKQFKSGVLAIALLLTLIFPQSIIENYYEKLGGTELSGMPTVLWVAMGVQEGPRAPGWYNDYSMDTFAQVDYDVEISSELAKNSIEERIGVFIDNPAYTKEFFSKKIMSTWCEPTCQSLWIGAVGDRAKSIDNTYLHNLYNGGKSYSLYYLVCSVIIANILVFAVVHQIGMVKMKTYNYTMLFPLLYIVGGVMFHIIWETKSQYIYMYYLMLVPLAASGIFEISNRLSKKSKSEADN